MKSARTGNAERKSLFTGISRSLWLLAMPVLALPPLVAFAPRTPGLPSPGSASILAAFALVVILRSLSGARPIRVLAAIVWCSACAVAGAALLPWLGFLGIPPLSACYALLIAAALVKPVFDARHRVLVAWSVCAAAVLLILSTISLLALAFDLFSVNRMGFLPMNAWEWGGIALLIPAVTAWSPPTLILGERTRGGAVSASSLVVIGLAAAGLIVYTGMNLFASLSGVRQDASARLKAITELKREEIEAHIAEMRGLCERIRGIPEIGQALDEAMDGTGRGASRFAVFLGFLKTQPAISDVLILDSRGRRLGGMGGTEPLQVERKAVGEIAGTDKIAFIDLHPHGEDSYRYGFAIPMTTPTGRAASIVLLLDPYAWLYPLLSKWPIPSKSAENLIARLEGDSVLYLNPLRFDSAPPLTKRIPLTSTRVASVQAVGGRTGVVEGRDYRNAEVLAFIAPVGGTPWFLSARVDESEALAEYYERLAWVIVTISLLAALAATGLAMAVRWRGARELKARLREEEGRSWLHGVISLSQSEIYVFQSRGGKVVFANRGACESLGYDEREFAALAIDDFFKPQDQAAFDAALGRLERGEAEKETLLGDHRRKDGRAYPVEVSLHAVRHERGKAVLALAADISERIAAESERVTTLQLLALVNEAKDTRALYRGLLEFVQRWSGCEAVGMRLQEGDDFPYLEYSGFGEEFVSYEKTICSRGPDGRILRDESGVAFLDCMCGNIIRGRFDPSKPFFTPGGSFWSNGTTELLAETTEADRQGRTRNRCNTFGYESVALVPLRSGDSIFGLFQLNDHRKGMFTPRFIELMERLCGSIGRAIAEKRLRDALETRERSYRLLFSTMEVGFALHQIVLDGEGAPKDYVFLEANSAFERMTGLKADEIRGRSVLEVMPGTESYWIETYGRVALEGGSVRFENYSSVLDKHFEVVTYSPERGKFATLISDTTARKKDELRQRAEKERLAVTLGSIGDGVITADVAGRVELMNRVAERLTGWGAEEARGRPLAEIYVVMGEADRRRIEDPAARAMAGATSAELAEGSVLLNREGKELLVADTGSPIRDEDGRALGVVIVFRDITEQRRLQEAIQRGEKLEALGTIAGGIAHDFNNLLGGVFGYMDLASRAAGPDGPGRKYLDSAMGVYERAKDLTKQLLTFSKGGAPDRKPANLGPVLRQCVEFALAGSNVKPEFGIDPDMPPCEFDVNQIQQAVDNLAINAKQAMPGGGRFRVSARRIALDGSEGKGISGDFAEVSCTDDGPGIPAEILGRIFDPFFTTKATGSGLGLATSYSIMKKHGGTLEAESAPGSGATFRFYLPCARTGPSNADEAQAREYAASGRILIMDDEDFLLEVLEVILESMGFSAAKASNGDAALAALEDRDPARPWAGAILDLTVPGGKGGLEIIKELKARHPGLPVIASSGYSENPAMAAPADFGFDGAIRKPYLMADVAKVLERVIGRP